MMSRGQEAALRGVNVMSLVTIHTIISLVAAALGIPVVAGLVARAEPGRWTIWFLVFAVAATGTGFVFPFIGVTPAFAVGILATLVLAATLAAGYLHDLAGAWRTVWVLGLIVSEFFLVFVTVAQAFAKVPALVPLAPGGGGPVFAAAELVTLAVFVAAGFLALRRGRRLAV